MPTALQPTPFEDNPQKPQLSERFRLGVFATDASMYQLAPHAALSQQIVGHRLLPSLAKAPANAWVVSNGFSCRHQIADFTERKPMHVAEALRAFI